MIDECESDPCLNGGTCEDAVNSYSCTCPSSELTGDRCETNIHSCYGIICENNGTFVVWMNSSHCDCLDGFTGQRCENIDECFSSPCDNGGTCIDGINSFQCNCTDGFSGDRCETGNYTIFPKRISLNSLNLVIHNYLWVGIYLLPLTTVNRYRPTDSSG